MGFDRNAASDQAFGHKPVLLEECLTALDIKPDGIYVDGTLGRAGHSLEIVKKLTGNGRLICLDRDETAIEAAKIRLADYLDRVTLVHSNFSRIAEGQHTEEHQKYKHHRQRLTKVGNQHCSVILS